jgi:CrcB protein
MLDKYFASRTPNFPVGILIVNMVGSFILALLTGFTLDHGMPSWVQVLLGTGFCGALTTFSTFSFDVVKLWQDDARGRAMLNAVLNICAGLGAAAIGLFLAAAL